METKILTSWGGCEDYIKCENAWHWTCIIKAPRGTTGQISQDLRRGGHPGVTVKASSPPPAGRCHPPEPWARAPCLEHTVHTTICGMDTQRRRARMSQNSIVQSYWKQARGEAEWGHLSPEEARTQEERVIEGCSQAEKTEEKSKTVSS